MKFNSKCSQTFRESDLDLHPEGGRLRLRRRRGAGGRRGGAGVRGVGRQPAIAHQVVRGGQANRERPQVRIAEDMYNGIILELRFRYNMISELN